MKNLEQQRFLSSECRKDARLSMSESLLSFIQTDVFIVTVSALNNQRKKLTVSYVQTLQSAVKSNKKLIRR